MTATTVPTVPHTTPFIAGEFVESTSSGTFPTYNPATGAILAEVEEAGSTEVDRAVAAAAAAFEGPWSRMELTDRARLLRQVGRLLEGRVEEIARLETADSGKPLWETRLLVEGTAAWMDFYADIMLHHRSDVIPGPRGYLNYTLRQPLGVVAGIVPWNFPLSFAALKAAPVLASGNTLVLKPAEQTPLTALVFADLCREAGFPEGVVNVLPGHGATTGAALVAHPGVAGVSFTGSTEVGREIGGVAGGQLKKAVLELGGKSPNIVFADAIADHVLDTAVYMFAYNQGQVCSAGSRLLVEERVYDDVLAAVLDRTAKVRVGDPLDAGTQVGAVISEPQLHRIEGYVQRAQDDGATLLSGGAPVRPAGLENGWFYAPTVFGDVDPAIELARDEVFGPVVAVLPFRDEDHVVRLANDVGYGLTAGVFTTDIRRAHRLAERLHAGIVYVNTMNAGLSPGSPIGGWKQSGLGIERGIEGVLEFTEIKNVVVNLTDETPAF